MTIVEAINGNGGQIGGGATWFANLVGEARNHAREALELTGRDWGRKPVTGPHPREEALRWCREAVDHLNEVLQVEAPTDAIVDTRHALEELQGVISTLEGLPNLAPDPGVLPTDRFQHAIDLLTGVEQRLNDPLRIGIP